MATSNVDEVLCLLLDHGSRDVVHSVCGVLMNLTADAAHQRLLVRPSHHAALVSAGGVVDGAVLHGAVCARGSTEHSGEQQRATVARL
jgi:hypothetical protein